MPKNKRYNRLLIVRFSAMGDVAMCAIVLRAFLAQNPDVSVRFVSLEIHRAFFEGVDRLEFVGVNLKKDYKGILAMSRLATQLLRDHKYDAVIDLHSVLRTHMLRFAFYIRMIPVFKMYKLRDQRNRLTRRDKKIKSPLKSIPECYADVFRRAGFSVTLDHSLRPLPLLLSDEIKDAFSSHKTRPWLAIAPFAQHKGKIYPADLMFEVIKQIALTDKVQIFLLGCRGAERDILNKWSEELPNIHLVAGKISLSQEMILISHMDLMLSMDSANMHIASLLGVRTVSVWGATHRFAGFLGYGQSVDDVVDVEMDCRPCSIFGNKECYKGTYECIRSISPESIVSKVIRDLECQ